MSIHIDLNMTMLPETHRVFLARPGEQYTYFSHFRAEEFIGPDLPLVELEPGVPVTEHEHLDDMLKRAMAYRRLKNMRQLRFPDELDDMIDLSQYKERESLHSQSSEQFKAILRGYFELAQKGDLVLIPPRAWTSDALLVEFTTNPENMSYGHIPYGNRRNEQFVKIPVRHFRLLRSVPKRLLPKHVLDVVGAPNAFVEFGHADANDLIDLAYDDFTARNHYISTFNITKDKYTVDHEIRFAAFVKFISANVKAVSESSDDKFTIAEAILGDFEGYIPSLQSHVSSPGWLRLRDERITPLVISVLFALAVEIGPAAARAAEEDMITMGNSKAPKDDECTMQVHKMALDLFKLLRLNEDWPQACELARKNSEETGMQSQSTISESEGARP